MLLLCVHCIQYFMLQNRYGTVPITMLSYMEQLVSCLQEKSIIMTNNLPKGY